MSKAKKTSLTGTSDRQESYHYKPKDLIWAKMKGFPPWPSMIVEPPTIELMDQPHKPNCKCVFFFGTRNFAWIETNNIKPFEGPWKEQFSKVNKPNSFRTALEDIKNYIDDPTEIDADINKSIGINHATEADFDKIRDGLNDEDEEDDNANDETNLNISADNNGLAVGSVVGTETDDAIYKTPVKRSKPKSTPMTGTKSAKSAITIKPATKRRRSSQANANSNKRKRSNSVNALDSYLERKSPPLRRKINTSLAVNLGSSGGSRRTINTIGLLDRPVVARPEAQAIDMNARSQTLAERDITPSKQTFGFLGLGIMGSTIVKDLICTGHKVVVWNRTMSKCKPFEEAGAVVKDTPMDVVDAADIIFCCVSGPKASKDLVFGNCGVLSVSNLCNKAYVEMTTIDPETSQDIADGIMQSNGRYLEVQIHGTRQEAEDGMLIILAGGDRTVFDECYSCFKTIAKNTFFLGAEVGNACKVNLILQTIVGVSLVGLAEALALADRFSISLKDIINIFELTPMKSQLLLDKGREMANGVFNPQQPLCHMQKDLRLVLSMAEQLDQSMPVTATTNEVFKHTKRLGYSDHDSSAVFKFSTKIQCPKIVKNSFEQNKGNKLIKIEKIIDQLPSNKKFGNDFKIGLHNNDKNNINDIINHDNSNENDSHKKCVSKEFSKESKSSHSKNNYHVVADDDDDGDYDDDGDGGDVDNSDGNDSTNNNKENNKNNNNNNNTNNNHSLGKINEIFDANNNNQKNFKKKKLF